MSTATKNKPATGTSNAPPAAPANEPAFGPATSGKPNVQCFMSSSVYEELATNLGHAHALVDALVHVFGGDAEVDMPTSVKGLFGTLQAAVSIMGLANTALLDFANLPDQLRENVRHGLSILELALHLQEVGDENWLWAPHWYCAYFDSAAHCIARAITSLGEQVQIRREAA